MISKNNHQILKQRQTNQVPHYSLRKLSIGVASVLLSTTFYLGAATAHADTNTSSAAVPSASAKLGQVVRPSAADTTTPDTSAAVPTSSNQAQGPATTLARGVDSAVLPNSHQISVTYIDDNDDNNQAVIKTETLTGVTDQTVPLKLSVPENYVLNETAPSDYTFKGTGNADITIHLRHATKDVSATDPYAKFERTYSIVQKIPQITHDVNGNVTYTTKTLLDKWKFNMQRTATQDLVTGEISYGPWEVDPADVHGPEGIHSPEFSIDKIAHTKLTSPIWGASDDLLQWWTGENTPEKYQEFIASLHRDPNQIVGLVSAGGFDGNNGINDFQKKWFDQGTALGAGAFRSLNSDTGPYWGWGEAGSSFWVAGSSHNILELVPVYQDYAKTFDLQWETGLSDTPYDDLKELFPDDSKPIELISEPVTIPVTIKYIDSTTGKVVDTKPLTTNYYQDFLIPDQTPAGYVAADAGAFTKHHSVRPTAGDALQTTFEIKVNKLVTVTPDAPKTPNDKLPDNPTKSYPSGVGANDLNKTVTRTIKVIAPTGQVTTTKQTVHLTREAVVDEVTGEVTYGNWTTGEWGAVPVPVIAGYTPSQREVPAVKVTATTKSQVITINYTALSTTSTPTKPQATVAGGDAKAPATNATVTTTPVPAAERRLPQTGNQTASTSQILGLLVAGLATGLGLWRRKKKDQQG